jgi:hypothetical protein
MKAIAILGVLLMLLGFVGLVQKSITYTKDKDTAELGPFELSVTHRETVALPLGASVAALAAGAVLLAVGLRRAQA